MIAIIGYAASVLLGISLLVNNDLKFRWLNTFGCLFFIVYGIFINAFPIILTNTALLLINLFYLVKIYRTEEDFDLIEFGAGDKLIEKFLSFHQPDIKNYFPDFNAEEAGNEISFAVLRDMVIANIFVAGLQTNGTAVVKINYTVPKYRDYKVGKFIFDKEKKYLVAKGVKRVVYTNVHNKNHENFLKKMGFTKTMFEGKECYVKSLV
ncbi:MAG: hypothetical protein JWQ96_396 [Segetibacter sp.]|nr:hypothetical protein [Segetibacter sp.]